MDLGIGINEDGTASMTTKVSISEALYEMMAGMENAGGDETAEETPDNQDHEDDDTASDEKEIDLDDFVKETIDGETYYSASETKEYASYEELAYDLIELEATDGILLFESVKIEKAKSSVYAFELKTAVMDKSSLESSVDMTLPDDWFKVTMTVKMPGEIVVAEGGEILEDGSVQFLMNNFSEAHVFFIQSEVELFNVTRAIIIWIIGLSVIAVVIFMHFKNKKKLSVEVQANEIDTTESKVNEPDENDTNKANENN